MKDFTKFETELLDKGEELKNTFGQAFSNIGKLVALLAAAVTVIVTFTDVRFGEFSLSSTVPTLLLLLISSYIIYFSLEDSGERLGEKSPDYIKERQRFDSLRDKITGDSLDSLRKFLMEYTEQELSYRRRELMLLLAISDSEYRKYKNDNIYERKKLPWLKKIDRLKPCRLTPKALLSIKDKQYGGELDNPERGKYKNLFFKLLPSSICMALTVSIILSVKTGLSYADVLNAILKLSCLPLIGFRGYSSGYSYSKNTMSLWYRTRSDILEAFLSRDTVCEHTEESETTA